MEPSLRCEACNAPLEIDAIDGLCPRCYGEIEFYSTEFDENDEPEELEFD